MSINSKAINTASINSVDAPTNVSQDIFVYNGFWLCNKNYLIQTDNRRDVWNIDLPTSPKPQTDGRFVFNQFIRNKSITFNVAIIWDDNLDDVEDKLDIFKKNCYAKEKELEINVNGRVRVAIASTTAITNIQRPQHGKFITCDLTLSLDDPVAFYERGLETKEYTNLIDNINWSIFYDWSNKTYPIYSFLFKTWNAGITWVSINVWWFTTVVTQTISDNDILIVDTDKMQVLYNNSVIDYDWPIDIPLTRWINPLQITFTDATTINADLTVAYKKYFI